jgi:Na+-transporting NADH:ubiquinone oxidoreductase subunit C
MSLKDLQELNRSLDKKKNILVAAGFNPKSSSDIEQLFENRIEQLVIKADGSMVLNKLLQKPAENELFPLFRVMNCDNVKLTESFVYPVTAKGLWSTIYGYLAVSFNGKEVKGITFYKHGETPGLGAEVEKAWFRKNFIGKKLYRGNNLIGIEVVKGRVIDHAEYKTNSQHMVDGISGATLTCNGISKMTKIIPRRYSLFFNNVKG